MAKELVVRDHLTNEMIVAGDRLIKYLDKALAKIKASFWLLFPEKDWKLVLVSPLIKSLGPKEIYKRIQNYENQADPDEEIIPITNIWIMTEDNEIAHSLNYFVKTHDNISNIRLSKNVLNGHFIEDLYIYRVNLNDK